MNIPAGIALQLAATLAFALMSALVRGVAERVPSGEIVFFRSFIGMVPLLLWLAWRGELASALITRQPFGHAWRGLIGVTSMWMGFAALAFIPLAEAIAFAYATPLVLVILACLMLGERVPAYRWAAVIFGLVGVSIMLWPALSKLGTTRADGHLIGASLALVGAVIAGLAVTQARRLTATETDGAIVFYFFLVAGLAGLTTLPLGWVVPEGEDLAVLILLGLSGGVGQICLTSALRHAPASVVAPFNYATLLWATLFGMVFFQEIPHPVVILGAAIVVASGLMIAWRERRRAAKEPHPDTVSPGA